jgi:hypothetical protein
MTDEVRRFPLPWTIEGNHTCFWVQDADGKRVAYVYFKESGLGRTSGEDSLTRAEALRIARNIAKLPDLLKRLSQQRLERQPPAVEQDAVEQGRQEDA